MSTKFRIPESTKTWEQVAEERAAAKILADSKIVPMPESFGMAGTVSGTIGVKPDAVSMIVTDIRKPLTSHFNA